MGHAGALLAAWTLLLVAAVLAGGARAPGEPRAAVASAPLASDSDSDLASRVRAYCAAMAALPAAAGAAPVAHMRLRLCAHPATRDPRLATTSPGFCRAVQAACGSGREGAVCVKQAVEARVSDRSLAVATATAAPALGAAGDGTGTRRGDDTLEVYFLCSPDYARIAALWGSTGDSSAQVASLSALLGRARLNDSQGDRASGNGGGGSGGQGGTAQQLLQTYREQARWSELAAWSPAERVAHFLDALALLPDNLHCIDRLAVALEEEAAATAAAAAGGQEVHAAPAALRRARAMLLTYAVLRGLALHPEQRPLMPPVRGLLALPVWTQADLAALQQQQEQEQERRQGGGEHRAEEKQQLQQQQEEEDEEQEPTNTQAATAGAGGAAQNDGADQHHPAAQAARLSAGLRRLERPDAVHTMRDELAAFSRSHRGRRRASEGEYGAFSRGGACTDDDGAGNGGVGGREQQEGLHIGGSWEELHLVREGRTVAGADDDGAVATAFPGTLQLLREVDAIVAGSVGTGGGTGADVAAATASAGAHHTSAAAAALRGGVINARISSVAPGTHITAHCGVSNAKLRVHLPLRVPAGSCDHSTATDGEGAADTEARQEANAGSEKGGAATSGATELLRCGLRVADRLVQWRVGEAVLFDDSFEHEVWWRWRARGAEGHDGTGAGDGDPEADGRRVVLILDVFHPQLEEAARTGLRQRFGSTG